MNKSNRVNIENPVQDVLTTFLRESAQKMLQIAIEQEVNDFIATYKSQRLEDGRQRVVKNGYLPERGIHTGIGTIKIGVPRVRNRSIEEEKIVFNSWWIPRHMRRTATLDVWFQYYI